MIPPAHRHTIHQHLHGWDNGIAAVTRIAPGESLEFDVADASGGQLVAGSTVADVGRMDLGKINPVTGPVHIDPALHIWRYDAKTLAPALFGGPCSQWVTHMRRRAMARCAAPQLKAPCGWRCNLT